MILMLQVASHRRGRRRVAAAYADGGVRDGVLEIDPDTSKADRDWSVVELITFGRGNA